MALRRRLLVGSHTTLSAFAGRQQMADWFFFVFGTLCRMLEGRALDMECTVAEAPRIHLACDVYTLHHYLMLLLLVSPVLHEEYADRMAC